MNFTQFPRAAVLAALLASPSVAADITGTTGNIITSNPLPSVAPGAFESDTRVPAYEERQRRVLIAPMNVDITNVGVYDATNPMLTPGVIAPGTTVNSYFLHADAVSSGPVTLSGDITFDEDILGIQITDAGLDQTDGPLGAPLTTYPTGVALRGLNLANGDVVALLPGRRTIRLSFDVFNVTDQIRVITAGQPTEPGMTFSMDFQGPSRGVVGPWGMPVFEGDILTVAANPPLGPWRAEFLPPTPPGVVIDGNNGPGFRLGLMPTPDGLTEVDALSYGNDTGRRLRFSVDEFAVGAGGAVNGVIAEVSPPGPSEEASADTFSYLSNIFAPTIAGNVQFTDGNGDTVPGVGLLESNPATPGLPDVGDNLDAVDFQTAAAQLPGPVFVSLDSAFLDPLEGAPANSGTAVANGFVGGDVIAIQNTVAGPVPQLFIPANQLGLDRVPGTQPDADDLDALALSSDGDGVFNPEQGVFNDGSDWILFSVRRGSAVIGMIDSRLGIPIDAGDILTVPQPGGGSPFPAIVVRADALGLASFRQFPMCGTTPDMDRSFGCDDVDAMDTYEGRPDTDGDGFFDDVDNCTLIPNPNQLDADGDGYGNACDTDLNDDCITNIVDLSILRTVFFTNNRVADFNGDGIVNLADLGIMRTFFFQPPGPGLGFCP
ncbi:MAG: hypothetical protein AAFU65_06870 [Pseudomonadota bacterium]